MYASSIVIIKWKFYCLTWPNDFFSFKSKGFFNAKDLEGREEEVGGALYRFPHYCDILALERNCLEGRSVTVGIKVTMIYIICEKIDKK